MTKLHDLADLGQSVWFDTSMRSDRSESHKSINQPQGENEMRKPGRYEP